MRRGAIKKRQCRGEWVGSALRVGGRVRQVLHKQLKTTDSLLHLAAGHPDPVYVLDVTILY